jgi:small subunit ribosomal protein S15
MALNAEQTGQILKDFQRKANDTGSSEVQIALLSKRITSLTEHFKVHNNDNHGRRGLQLLVNQRRGLLDYLKRTDEPKYQQVIERLGIRR